MRKPKANRAYSLDLEVIMMLEKYAASHDTWGKKKSRSKIVNDAIRWFLTGNLAERLHSAENLQEQFNLVCQERDELLNKLQDQNRFDLN